MFNSDTGFGPLAVYLTFTSPFFNIYTVANHYDQPVANCSARAQAVVLDANAPTFYGTTGTAMAIMKQVGTPDTLDFNLTYVYDM